MDQRSYFAFVAATAFRRRQRYAPRPNSRCSHYSRRRLTLSLIAVLLVIQSQEGYSANPAKSQIAELVSCATEERIAEFTADIEKLAESTTGRTNISQEYIARRFSSCSLEMAETLFAKSGFAVERYNPAEIMSEKRIGTQRLALAEKHMRSTFSKKLAVPIGSLNCRFILREDQSGTLKIEGFFYVDAP